MDYLRTFCGHFSYNNLPEILLPNKVTGPDTKLELHKKEPTKLELQKNELTKLELHKLEPMQKRTLWFWA